VQGVAAAGRTSSLAGTVVVERTAEELRDGGPDIAMPDAAGVQRKEREHLHQGEDAAIAQPQCGGALGVEDDGAGQAVGASSPIRQWWLRYSRRRRRRLAAKPISRRAARLRSAQPISKS
jgi:hypothetical protein